MDAPCRHQMDEARAAVDTPSAPPAPPVPGPVRAVQATAARVAARLHRSPWWIIAAGVLAGAERLRARIRPPRERPAAAHTRPTGEAAPPPPPP
ncbi:MAG TPA: hypothetical protein VHN78_06080, partial [Chloroflexota bacterium]|nr:hypothetical protein [Chloroflexota bacterium]